MKMKAIFLIITAIVGFLVTNIAFSNSKGITIIPMQERKAQTFYIEGRLGDLANSDFMVDTGSSYSTINEETLSRLQQSGKATYVKDLLGVLADGSEKQVQVYRLSSLTLGNKCEIQDIEVAIFPGATRHILGLNTLRKMGSFEFSFAPPQLIIKQCS
ncbi:MAG: retroviral-like aspartic protease family protein [Gammaproteobacteria bacterium]|nr:retroviral-like aspartic protease family protein [Gammaproteobacteria bacterium]